MHAPLILQAGKSDHSYTLAAQFIPIFIIPDIPLVKDRIHIHSMVFYQAI